MPRERARDESPYRRRFTSRTAETLTIDGDVWTVLIDWAERTDGTRVPTSVTISSVGGGMTDGEPGQTILEAISRSLDAEPQPLTAGLLRRINWRDAIWTSRTTAAKEATDLPWEPDWAAKFDPPSPASKAHGELLRLVAYLFWKVGGETNPTVAIDVMTHLELRGATTRSGRLIGSGDNLRSERALVRRLIAEAKAMYPEIIKNGPKEKEGT